MMVVIFHFQSLESHEQSAAALEQSSFGILSAETLAEASAFANGGASATLGASFGGFQGHNSNEIQQNFQRSFSCRNCP